MLRSICYGICVLALAAALSGCVPMAMQATMGAGVHGFGPGAKAAQAHGSWEGAVAAYDKAIPAGLYLITTLALLCLHSKEVREMFAAVLDKVGPQLPLDGQSRSDLFDSGTRDVFQNLRNSSVSKNSIS